MLGKEGRTQLLSGIYGLNWFPTGPEVVARILAWIGFTEWKLLWWHQEVEPGRGRLELVASKIPGFLSSATRL